MNEVLASDYRWDRSPQSFPEVEDPDEVEDLSLAGGSRERCRDRQRLLGSAQRPTLLGYHQVGDALMSGDLPSLGERLQLPTGWTFRARVVPSEVPEVLSVWRDLLDVVLRAAHRPQLRTIETSSSADLDRIASSRL